MNFYPFELAGHALQALPSGVLWWPDQRIMAVSDLHLGKAERFARKGIALLPPYETQDTLNRLEAQILDLDPTTIISVGDSFDDLTAAKAIEEDIVERLSRMAAGRKWIWIAGNHDPGPLELPGSHRSEINIDDLTFRHIAGASGFDVSGHYHPKARICLKRQTISRPCFVIDACRVILPAFGTYTGGLRVTDPVFDGLVTDKAIAVLVGKQAIPIPRRAVLA